MRSLAGIIPFFLVLSFLPTRAEEPPSLSVLSLSSGDPKILLQCTRKRASSFDITGHNKDNVDVDAGGNPVLLNVTEERGAIVRMWFTFMTDSPEYLREVRLRFTFDDKPTVDDIPIGMLFGTGPWRVNDVCSPRCNVMRSRPGNKDSQGVGQGSFNLNWEMPFAKNARVELLNDTKASVKVFYHIDYMLGPVVETPPLLFHAQHNRTRFTRPATDENDSENWRFNHSFAEIENQEGLYVGTILAVESHPEREGKWYEGDEMFFVDGESWPPSIHGTGTEDYFGMSWGVHRPYQAFDHGVTHYERDLTEKDRFYDGRFTLYRWHLSDPVVFHRSLHASIEAGHRNDCRQHYESVSFWYGRTPGTEPNPPLLTPAEAGGKE